ncbi:hypothetical protein [Sphingopyxis sp. USTB-05]|uniref:hypothetical protein n=1 Tax=Sphingopyxis sp. USTB-05 TaxID=2830667 RepID=UPI002078EAF3|nr:hypothetical protein [Sphingopyxis sp. USTB-05]USI77585.1 hypothetical protein KEC45_01310 [Sphingopyxis sp. USTB-05]
MAQIVVDKSHIAEGETYFAAYIDRPNARGSAIVAELATGLTGPVTPDRLRARKLSGFELPALELIELAQRRADEQGVKKILLIDPYGWLPLAKVNRYARR